MTMVFGKGDGTNTDEPYLYCESGLTSETSPVISYLCLCVLCPAAVLAAAEKPSLIIPMHGIQPGMVVIQLHLYSHQRPSGNTSSSTGLETHSETGKSTPGFFLTLYIHYPS